MRPIGFSTGALARGDFRRGIDLQRPFDQIDAVELSALRDHELPYEVGAMGKHLPLGATVRHTFPRVAHRVPDDCPLIIESVVEPDAIELELTRVQAVFESRAAATA